MTTSVLLDFMDVSSAMSACGTRINGIPGVVVTRNQLFSSTLSNNSLLHIVDLRVEWDMYVILEAHMLGFGHFGIRAVEHILGEQTVRHTWIIDGGKKYRASEDLEHALCIRCLSDCDAETCPATAKHDTILLDKIPKTVAAWAKTQLGL